MFARGYDAQAVAIVFRWERGEQHIDSSRVQQPCDRPIWRLVERRTANEYTDIANIRPSSLSQKERQELSVKCMEETHIVVRIFPVSKTCECLHDLDPLPCLSKRADGEFVGKFLTWFKTVGLEKFARCHEKGCEKKGTL